MSKPSPSVTGFTPGTNAQMRRKARQENHLKRSAQVFWHQYGDDQEKAAEILDISDFAWQVAAQLTTQLDKGAWLPKAIVEARETFGEEINLKLAVINNLEEEHKSEARNFLKIKLMNEIEKEANELKIMKRDEVHPPRIWPLFEERSHSQRMAFAIHAHRLLKQAFQDEPARKMSLGLRIRLRQLKNATRN